MDRDAALRLAERHFPSGPEAVVASLGAEVRLRPINIDGWCFRKPAGGAVITLNQNAPETRRRFTLAHVVAHLLLNTQSDVVGRGGDIYDPRSKEEKAANQLGSELLLPPAVLGKVVRRPVDSQVIARVAKLANVSEIVVALRLVRSPAEFEMLRPVIARLEEGTVKWKIPLAYPLPDDVAQAVYDRAFRAGGTTRVQDTQGNPVLMCALSNPGFQVLVFYWLSEQQARTPTVWETRKEMEDALFADDPNFRIMVNSFLGGFKHRVTGLKVDEAFQAFYERYGHRLQGEQADRFHSAACHTYIRFRLAEYVLEG